MNCSKTSQSLYAELMNLFPRMVTNNDNRKLNELITMDEVKKAIDSMEEDRAPGPDGFNVNFVKICWEVIKKDLLKMVCKS